MKLLKTMKNTRVFACQGHDPRDSCQILSFLVVLPDGFWAVDGFSQTKSRLLLLAAFPKSRKSKKWEMQNRQFWCFCGVPPISAALEAGNPGNLRALEMAFRKRSGYCKIYNFGAFVGFPPFRRPWKPEIQEIQGAFGHRCSPHLGGLGSRKFKKIQGAWKWPPEKERGIAKSTILVLL